MHVPRSTTYPNTVVGYYYLEGAVRSSLLVHPEVLMVFHLALLVAYVFLALGVLVQEVEVGIRGDVPSAMKDRTAQDESTANTAQSGTIVMNTKGVLLPGNQTSAKRGRLTGQDKVFVLLILRDATLLLASTIVTLVIPCCSIVTSHVGCFQDPEVERGQYP